jgi:hypothetical protein
MIFASGAIKIPLVKVIFFTGGILRATIAKIDVFFASGALNRFLLAGLAFWVLLLLQGRCNRYIYFVQCTHNALEKQF